MKWYVPTSIYMLSATHRPWENPALSCHRPKIYFTKLVSDVKVVSLAGNTKDEQAEIFANQSTYIPRLRGTVLIRPTLHFFWKISRRDGRKIFFRFKTNKKKYFFSLCDPWLKTWLYHYSMRHDIRNVPHREIGPQVLWLFWMIGLIAPTIARFAAQTRKMVANGRTTPSYSSCSVCDTFVIHLLAPTRSLSTRLANFPSA